MPIAQKPESEVPVQATNTNSKIADNTIAQKPAVVTSPQTSNTNTQSSTTAIAQKPIEPAPVAIKKAEYIEDMGSKLAPVLTVFIPEQKIKQTCNWKVERFAYMQKIKVKMLFPI